MTRHSDDTDANTGADTGRDADADADGDAVDPLRSPPDQRSVPELLRFGVVNVDKPAGPSSHQLSAWVRDAINETLATLDPDGSPIHGVAHAGTLDPKVTGCLPTLTGDATRAAQVFLEEARSTSRCWSFTGRLPRTSATWSPNSRRRSTRSRRERAR